MRRLYAKIIRKVPQISTCGLHTDNNLINNNITDKKKNFFQKCLFGKKIMIYFGVVFQRV